jgi:acetylornithine/N-succinyldiaminopimelate aminotransferase
MQYFHIYFSSFGSDYYMDIFSRESTYFFNTYKRIPLEIDRGTGVYIYTKDGNRYLDLFAGLAVNSLGYGHPRILSAIREQSEKYLHLSNFYYQEPQLRLAELLASYSGYNKIFFSNSGTEAIEGAIKISRKWAKEYGKTDFVSFSNAFHGRTMGALSLMDSPKYRDGYEPFLQNCSAIPFNDREALLRTISDRTAAVVLEFIQGEGGVRPADASFISLLSELKKKHGFLLIADEIQSGLGRTGTFFGYQHYDIQPDIVVIAKPLGGGLPLGAILGDESVASVLQPGAHGTTFGGNPVACAAGIVVLEELIENGLIDNARVMGASLFTKLHALGDEFPALVKEVRGYGLMAGLVLTMDGEPIITALRERGILLNCTAQTVLRFLPPLIIQEEHLEFAYRTLREILKKFSLRKI